MAGNIGDIGGTVRDGKLADPPRRSLVAHHLPVWRTTALM
jgi:hypothetical protein